MLLKMIQSATKIFTRNKSNQHYKKKKELIVEIKGELLYGVHPVRLALQAQKRTINKIFYNKYSEKPSQLAEYAQTKKIETQMISRYDLDELTRQSYKYKDHHVHQGIVADVSRKYQTPVDYFMPQFPDLKFDYDQDLAEENFILLLFDIKDPMNLGAILRSAYYFGINKVIVAGDRIDLNGIVSKTSSGALEMMSVYAVRHTVTFLEKLQSHGWRVLALTVPNTNCKQVVPLNQIVRRKKTILIVGSEGVGIPPEVLQVSDGGVFIPGVQNIGNQTKVGQENQDVSEKSITITQDNTETTETPEEEFDLESAAVDSLNVSVATALSIHHFLSK